MTHPKTSQIVKLNIIKIWIKSYIYLLLWIFNIDAVMPEQGKWTGCTLLQKEAGQEKG